MKNILLIDTGSTGPNLRKLFRITKHYLKHIVICPGTLIGHSGINRKPDKTSKKQRMKQENHRVLKSDAWVGIGMLVGDREYLP